MCIRPPVRARTPAKPPRPLCPHCRRFVVAVGYPLCWTCRQKPEVRALFPRRRSKFGRRGTGIGVNSKAPLPASPTDAVPGSEAKILVMMDRASKRQQLFHPEDAIGKPARVPTNRITLPRVYSFTILRRPHQE
jgi:hypothetical protein